MTGHGQGNRGLGTGRCRGEVLIPQQNSLVTDHTRNSLFARAGNLTRNYLALFQIGFRRLAVDQLVDFVVAIAHCNTPCQYRALREK
jgi:hypothetical protein